MNKTIIVKIVGFCIVLGGLSFWLMKLMGTM